MVIKYGKINKQLYDKVLLIKMNFKFYKQIMSKMIPNLQTQKNQIFLINYYVNFFLKLEILRFAKFIGLKFRFLEHILSLKVF